MYRQQNQGRPEWTNLSQLPQAWPGHPYHAQAQQGGHVAPHVHRPPPPPVHYPPQHHQQQHQHLHQHPHPHPHPHPHQHQHQHQHQHHVPGPMAHRSPYYHGSASTSPAGPAATRQQMQMQPQQMRLMRAPALVSPSAHQAVAAATSPRTPVPVASSPREIGNSNAGTPVPAVASNIPLGNVVTVKPPRPYTEYTMFYQLEREFILHRILTTEEEQAAKSPAVVMDQQGQQQTMALFQNDPLMPARFRSLPLRADWYISGKSKKPTKRKHRKSHGKIGFLELTRMIASRWAKVDDETRKYCKMMAAMELVKYKEDMESYNLYKDRLGAMGEIPADMKERILKKKRAAEKKDAYASKRAKIVDGVTVSSSGTKKMSARRPVIKADMVGSNISVTTRSVAAPTAHTNKVPPLPPIKLQHIARNSPVKAPMKYACPPVKAHQPIKRYEPIAHNSPVQQSCSNLDNDMEQFITSLVRSPSKSSVGVKMITPDRSAPKKRRMFRDKPALMSEASRGASTASIGQEILVPLKIGGTHDDEDHLDGIKMTFSGIDENEIAREFSDQVIHRGTTAIAGPAAAESAMTAGVGTKPSFKMGEPSFDYWDALVESPGM